jgi:hypothetical protein
MSGIFVPVNVFSFPRPDTPDRRDAYATLLAPSWNVAAPKSTIGFTIGFQPVFTAAVTTPQILAKPHCSMGVPPVIFGKALAGCPCYKYSSSTYACSQASTCGQP